MKELLDQASPRPPPRRLGDWWEVVREANGLIQIVRFASYLDKDLQNLFFSKEEATRGPAAA
jgi:hypothetical protein